MVDFERLRKQGARPRAIDPIEIFRRLPKPPGVNDLYSSQTEVLQGWFARRTEPDVVVKLHTGGGKTLVGLLIAQSTLTELREPVLYLAPTVQLVKQTLEKASAHGIEAVQYQNGVPLDEEFTNAKAIMVATYKALFNGKSLFGVRGGATPPQGVGAVVLDDAHAAFPLVRDSFTLSVLSSTSRELYEGLAMLFRNAFKDQDRLGTFDDVVSGADDLVLEVPYWAWYEKIDAVREHLRSHAEEFPFQWPLLRDRLHLCHALLSTKDFVITPIVPAVNLFPSFSESPRRVYMSATMADDSEIVRTFDAAPRSVKTPLASRSLAGVSERMILAPDLMPFELDVRAATASLMESVAKDRRGVVLLAPSDVAASRWAGVAEVATGSAEVERIVSTLQKGHDFGPVVFANRYDGIDLPGDACRLLVLDGLPTGTSRYELFRASALYGGSAITRMIAQRVEQGIGRGARGSGDHCVVLLIGAGLAGWVAKESNFRFLTDATRAQIEIGIRVSVDVTDEQDLRRTVNMSLNRDRKWVEYHAETLDEMVGDSRRDEMPLDLAAVERRAFNLWGDGVHDKAITKIEQFLDQSHDLDSQMRGWMEQLTARIAYEWGEKERARRLQTYAFSHNRNLQRPQVQPPYRPLAVPSEQAEAIARQIGDYRIRRGMLQSFKDSVTYLDSNASANQFEQALCQLGTAIGLTSERKDHSGDGPDVLWLLPGRIGLTIEAKSRKQRKNAFTKEQHGQLLVAEQWFLKQYPGYKCVRVSVHPMSWATGAASAEGTYAFTFEKLAAFVSDAKALLTLLCESQKSDAALKVECAHLLSQSSLRADRIVEAYLVPFQSKA